MIAPYLPNPAQTLLLKAALLKGDAALEAWQMWKSQVDLDDVEYPSYRLLPMLYHNLRRHNIKNDNDLQRLKGVYRLSWVENQFLFRQLPLMVERLQAKGITPILLKGAAMVYGYYHDHGCRPMHDLDILVRQDQMKIISEILPEMGWKRQHDYSDPLLAYRRELVFENEQKQEIDVHWHLLREWCLPAYDEAVWAHTTPISVQHQTALALNPTFALLHLCGHGYQWGDLPSFLWLADMHTIITAAPDQIDWQKVINLAPRYDLTIPLKTMLIFLATTLETPIPSDVLNTIKQIKPTKREISVHDVRSGDPNSIFRVVWKHWFYYVPVKQRAGKSPNPFEFFYYFCLHFQDVWGLNRWWHAPFYGIRLMINRRKENV